MPSLPHTHVPRARLHAPLNRGAAITVVRAPYGAGKTTLASEWLRSRDVDELHAWVAVPARATRDQFWAAVRQALGTSEHRADAFAAVTDDLENTASPVVLVLDAFEQVADALVYDELARLLLRHPQVRVLVLSRRTTEWEAGRGTRGLDIELVTWPALAFDADEMSKLLRAQRVDLDPTSLVTVTEGLPNLAVVASRALASSGLDYDRIDRVLADAVNPRVHRLLKDQRDSLARFAAVPQLNERLATTLTPVGESPARLLEAIETAGLGYWADAAGRRRFRLLRSVRIALRDEIAPSERRDVQRVARDWFLHHGETFTAFLMALESHEVDEAVSIHRTAGSEVRGWPRDRVASALARVPRELLAEEPTLLGLLGWFTFGEQPGRTAASAMLAWAGRRITDDPDRARPDRAHALAIKSMAQRLTGDWDGAAASARVGLEQFSHPETDDDEMRRLRPIAAGQFGTSLLAIGDLDAAASAFELAWDPSADPARDQDATDTAGLLAVVHTMRGAITTAERTLQRTPDRPRWTGSRELFTAPLFHLARADVHLENFRFTEAQHELARVARSLDHTEHRPLLMAAQARIDLGTGHPAASLASLTARNIDDAELSPYARVELATHRALLLLARGEPGQAEETLRGCPPGDPRVVSVRALVALVTDTPLTAYTLSHRALRRAVTPRGRTRSLVVATAAALRLHRGGITESLDELSVLLTEHGVRFPFALLPADDFVAVRDALSSRALPRAHDSIEALAVVPHLIPSMSGQLELSPREKVVLAELATNSSTTKIAERLYVSPNTVKAQLRSIYRKLGVTCREDAIVVATNRRLLSTE